MSLDVRLLDAPFASGAEIDAFMARFEGAGAVVSFTGQVRGGDDVEALELSHYAPLTLPAMEALAASAQARWGLDGVLVIHRVGEMAPGEAIVLVAAASRHRRAAFAAADYVMDHLKGDSWFWKRERRGGAWHWIEPRAEDRVDLARWGEGQG